MKIIEVIYVLWPIWILATIVLTCIVYLKSWGRRLFALSIAKERAGSDGMKKYRKDGRIINRLSITICGMLLFLIISIVYHGYLYIFKSPFHLPL